jgi:hypothetical protein
MTPGTTRERPTTTNSSWFRSLLVPLYAFGIALVLTLGVGSLAAPTTDVTAQNDATDLRNQRDDAQQQLAEANKELAELRKQLQEGDDPVDPAPTDPASGKLIIRAFKKDGKTRLDPDVEKGLTVSYTLESDTRSARLPLNADGIYSANRPTEKIVRACLRLPRQGWAIDPDIPATVDTTDPRLRCIDYSGWDVPPERNFEVDFRLIEA